MCRYGVFGCADWALPSRVKLVVLVVGRVAGCCSGQWFVVSVCAVEARLT